MSLTIIVTRDVQGRYRGFLGSIMMELAPGLYVSPRMNKSVRERVWTVLEEWHGRLGRGSITLLWRDKKAPGQFCISQLGEAQRDLIENDGLLLVRRRIKTRTSTKSAS